MFFNKFEFKYKDNLLYIYNYNKIKKLKSDLIIIEYKTGEICIKGNNLIIKELYKEYMIIYGNINEIFFDKDNYNDRS